jgi:hypothetical protein
MRIGLMLLLVFGAGLLVSQRAAAGEISGTITAQGRPVADTELRLTCPGRPKPDTARTDGFGRYRLVAPGATGRCTLAVGEADPAEVFVFAAPARYDFDLVGKSLHRR